MRSCTGRANLEIICANSSQAKGRVERANRTLQDRLVKELRLAGISDMAAGDAFLPSFIERHNQRLAVPPARREDLSRKPSTETDRLDDILCHRGNATWVRSLPFQMIATDHPRQVPV